jgi:hypothetical protein
MNEPLFVQPYPSRQTMFLFTGVFFIIFDNQKNLFQLFGPQPDFILFLLENTLKNTYKP